MFAARLLSRCLCEDGEDGSHCVSVHACTSKFSHLLRLADNFWWWVTIRVKQSYLGLFKCICNHVFVVSSSSHSASCFLSFSISGTLPQPGPVTGRETQEEYKARFIHLCEVVLLELMLYTSKIYKSRLQEPWRYRVDTANYEIGQIRLLCVFAKMGSLWSTLNKSLLILLLFNSTHD